MHECNNKFAFPLHSSSYTAILNIHCFFFPLVYIPRMDVKLDFICMGPVDLPEASEATKYEMKNPCRQWDSKPQPLDFKSDALTTELAGLVECCSFK